ncbi:MAG: DUF3617 family protein [Rhodocyclaceae bacterium]|jgi:hypothetical protein|nr:DUF3617 family protein [Rhodocyclaceae bacterium]
MKKLVPALALSLLAAPAFAGDMKAGLWEMKTLRQVVDGQDMQAQMRQMQQQMAGLPPEQRKQMEAMMGRQGMGMGPGGAMRMCISEEMAKRDAPVLDPDGQCQPAKVSRSGNTVRYEIDCMMEGRRSQGKGESTFSGNSVHSRMDMVTMDASGRHTMQSESQMTYLGPDCKGLAPVGAGRRR